MNKYKKGYTTGVYDMFHIGHLNVLNNAKEYCDYLLVGVSTDELVEEYKGKRPIIPFEERRKIVENIRCVDEVCTQENMNKLQAVLKHKCDVVFVGDDWKGTEKWLAYEKEFNEFGVDVVYLPYTQGTSSTILREIIYNELHK